MKTISKNINFILILFLIISFFYSFSYYEYISAFINKDTYLVELKKFNISKNNTNAKDTTIGINSAIKYAKEKGYKTVKLPKGHYSIDTSVINPIELSDKQNNKWTQNRQGITMQSNISLDLTNCILEMIPTEDPYYTIITISNCNNSKIIGGTILGDRDTHDYGMRINNNGDMLENGGFDENGNEVDNDTQVRTKDFIETCNNTTELPKKFFIIPLWNTSKSTVDGGCRYIYCYDENENYIGMSEGGNGFIKQAVLPEGTKKIKVSFKTESRLDGVYALTTREIYSTYEFGTGIRITDSNNIEIKNTVVKNLIGDCIGTFAPPLELSVDNLSIINCTLENARRQGISFVANGENYLVKDCNIGNINGTDPQSGIDFEHYGYMKKTIIDGCNFYDNKKWDIINYNGTDIEIKNCTFTGAVAASFGDTMNIHDNIFDYKDRPNNDKVYKKRSLNLSTKNNIVYNNKFYGGGIFNRGEDSHTYGNTFTNCFVDITNNNKNYYYNCDVNIIQNDNFPLLENNYFENCNVLNSKDNPEIEISKCTFKNSNFEGRGKTLVTNCIFDMKDKSVLNGWKTKQTHITYKNCTFKSSYTNPISLLGNNLNTYAIFENCIFDISRYTLSSNFGSLYFNNCEFNFNNLNTSKESIDLNIYAYEQSIWYFDNCSFKSEHPIIINGNDILNPIFSDNIYFYN